MQHLSAFQLLLKIDTSDLIKYVSKQPAESICLQECNEVHPVHDTAIQKCFHISFERQNIDQVWCLQVYLVFQLVIKAVIYNLISHSKHTNQG